MNAYRDPLLDVLDVPPYGSTPAVYVPLPPQLNVLPRRSDVPADEVPNTPTVVNLHQRDLNVLEPLPHPSNDNRIRHLASGLDGVTDAEKDVSLSLVVSGRTSNSRQPAARRRDTTSGEDWMKRRNVDGLRRSTVIRLEDYDEAHRAYAFAWSTFRPLNTLVTIRPYDIDQLQPAARIALWAWYSNKLHSMCRRLGFPFVAVMSRESADAAGSFEHMHMLMLVPPKFRERVYRVVGGWTKHPRHPADIDIKPATDAVTYTGTGKRRSAIGYVTKASPPQARHRDRNLWHKPGGSIWGWRCRTTLNIGAEARALRDAGARSATVPYRPDELEMIETA